jgi:peptidoglycan/LPS O-acetylase OafA/YrhL
LTQPTDELRYEDYLANSYRPGFDGLRGIGFLLVVTAHVPAVALFTYLQGWTGVWVFFAISGYLVTMLLLREEKSRGRIAFGPFLIRRFFRIVPSYWVAIFLYWLTCLTLPPLAAEYELFMARLPYYLAFMPEYAHTNVFTIFVHSWAVGVELKFYVFFPPLVFLLIRDANWRFAVTAVTAALLVANGSFIAHSYCALLFGVMLAFGLERPRGFALVARLTRVPLAVPLGFVVALFVMLRYTEQLPVVAVVATYLVAYTIMRQGVLRRILTWRPLVYLGQRSYGAYLLHLLGINFGYLAFGSTTPLGGSLTTAFCLAVTVPAAELLYQAVERPGVEYGRRLVDKMRAARKDAGAVV